MKTFIIKLWKTMSRPAVHISLGVLTLGGFILGVLFWGGFNTALEATNTEKFCISCHTMKDNVYQELQHTVHWSNRTGVRATCPDCHVPHNWTDKIARKIQASKEVFAQIFGGYNTPEDFEANRLRLARNEWARFQANGSLECKSCHNYDSMDWDKMTLTARTQMQQAAEKDQSCIDCHKGIAHQLPEDMSASSGMVGELESLASNTGYESGQKLISIKFTPLYVSAEGKVDAGLLEPASVVEVIDEKDGMMEVAIDGWRKSKGFGRVIQADFGKNIAVGTLEKESAQSDEIVTIGEKKIDDLTGLAWEKIQVKVWMKKEAMLNVADSEELWTRSKEAYDTNCSVCHTQPAPAHFDANTWPGMFNGMLAFVNFDANSEALVLKYLQMHSSDFVSGHH